MKENGLKVKHMVKVNTHSLRVHITKVSGRMINKMDMELKFGQMNQNLKVILKMVRSVERVNLIG